MSALAGLLLLLSAMRPDSGGAPSSSLHLGDENVCPSRLSEAIPARSPDASAGSTLVQRIWTLRGPDRDRAILEEIEAGNVPDFLRQLRPVTLTSRDRHGLRHTAVICVLPDYLAVGSDEDFVRVPLGLRAATDVAREFGFALPTRKIVDAIYQQSALRLSPKPMKPGPQMASTRYFATHNETIERLRGKKPLGDLVSGHKKDVVLTKRLLTRRGRIAIYGWHQKPGRPIQPLSTVHGARYADYSHGIRLVSDVVLLDGTPRSFYEVLGDSVLAGTLTHEGTIRDARRLMGFPSGPRRSGDE